MLYEQFCDFDSQWEKVSRKSIVGTGHIGHDLGSHKGFALEVMRGHVFWTYLKMCVIIFDLLPPILESGTVSGEMGS